MRPRWIAPVVLLAACTSDAETAEPTSTTTTQPATQPAIAAPTCEDGTFDGRGHILCTIGDGPVETLVVALHGRGSSPEEMQAFTELHTEAAEAGLAVVYAEGVDRGWADDTFAGDRDVAYLDGLIAELTDGPVGLVGFSNGASMALRYACERPDAVTAVVSVAGQLPRDPAIRPTGPVPLLEIYGTADPVRPDATGIPATPDRQPGQPTPTLSTDDTVAAFEQAGGPAELIRIEGGGHTWPSSRAPSDSTFGPIDRTVDATAEAIAFITEA